MLCAGVAALNGCGAKEGDAPAAAPLRAGEARQQHLPVRFDHLFQQGRGALGVDIYLVKLSVWHEAYEPVSGVLKLGAYGDVVGPGGRGNNADLLPWHRMPSGNRHRTSFYHQLSDRGLPKELAGPNHAADFVDLAVVARFDPGENDPGPWKSTTWVFACRRGAVSHINVADADPAFRAWLQEHGVPAEILVAEESR